MEEVLFLSPTCQVLKVCYNWVMGPLFIWLGSGRARRRGIHERGVRLDQAARAGLPVPPGAILPDELFRLFLDKDIVLIREDRVFVPDPELMHNTLFHSVRLPRFAQRVAIRPAFTPEFGPIPARLNVDPNEALEFAAALSAFWSDVVRSPTPLRADILVMEMVRGEHAGRAIIGNETGGELVTFSQGSGARESIALPAESGELPPFGRRLRLLLGGVRRTFGRGAWEVEWVDDGQICYLLEVSAVSLPIPAT